jgi:hypothetical protein
MELQIYITDHADSNELNRFCGCLLHNRGGVS